MDAGVLGFSNGLSWIAQGSDLKIVGGAQIGFHSLLVSENSGIDSVDQLKGKSVASQKQGSTADIVWNGVVLDSGNLVREDVTMQYVSPAKLTYPVKEIYEIGSEWPFPCMVVIASGDIVTNNRDAVNKMLDAQKEAIEMLQNDPAKAAGYITKEFIKEETLTKLDGTEVPAEDVIQAAIESQTFKWTIDEQDITRMQEISEMMIDLDMLKEKMDVTKALDLTWQDKQNKS